MNTDTSNLPPIVHEVINPESRNFLDIPQAKYIETQLINGMSQLQAKLCRAVFEQNGTKFIKWEDGEVFHFKLVFSPSRKIIRLEIYDTGLFPLLLEQIINNGYSVISSGEDVEFATIKTQQNGWLGWAHFVKKLGS